MEETVEDGAGEAAAEVAAEVADAEEEVHLEAGGGGCDRGDADAARRINELAVAWARCQMDKTIAVECEHDRVAGMGQDATTQFVQSRVQYEMQYECEPRGGGAGGGGGGRGEDATAAAGRGGMPTLRVRSPSLITPISGLREPGRGCTFCKVVEPNALLQSLLTFRGGAAAGYRRSLHATGPASALLAACLAAAAVHMAAPAVAATPTASPGAAVGAAVCAPARLLKSREQLELAVQASSVQAWQEAASSANDPLLEPSRLLQTLRACADGATPGSLAAAADEGAAQLQLSTTLGRRIVALRDELALLSRQGDASAEEAMKAMSDGTTARATLDEALALGGMVSGLE